MHGDGGRTRRRRVLAAAASALLAAACAGEAAPEEDGMRRFLALGDSYTIGEGVAAADRWPAQLAEALADEGFGVEVEIVARTGWTVAELDAAIDEADPRGPYDLVTLLIGVNDQYRGGYPDDYRPAFAAMLQRAIGFAGGNPGRVIVVSIPDWGVTPFAAGRDRGSVSGVIDAFNRAAREETASAGAVWVDVTTISRSGDPGLETGDGLHPSGEQYRRWVEAILPSARGILGD